MSLRSLASGQAAVRPTTSRSDEAGRGAGGRIQSGLRWLLEPRRRSIVRRRERPPRRGRVVAGGCVIPDCLVSTGTKTLSRPAGSRPPAAAGRRFAARLALARS
jgi:hypothetical protein